MTNVSVGGTAVPSFAEYLDARYVVDHADQFDATELRSAQQWVVDFETAVRDAVADQFKSPRLVPAFVEGLAPFEMPGWEDLLPWMQAVLFDAAMVGARTAQGGER